MPALCVAVPVLIAPLLLAACIGNGQNDSGALIAFPRFLSKSVPVPSPTAVGLSNAMFVDWPLLATATSYNVYWSADPNATPQSSTIVSASAPPVTIGGLANGVPYYATVSALEDSTEGYPSGQVSATPIASGSTDLSFNGTGMVTSSGGAGGTGANADDTGIAAVQDAEGRIVTVGSSKDAGGSLHLAVWRYKTDGTLDASFNGSGAVYPAFAGTVIQDEGLGVTIDSQGRVIAVGRSTAPSTIVSLGIWRFNPDGTPDTTFAGTGYTSTTGASGTQFLDQPFDVTTDHEDRIVILGDSLPSTADPWFALWRFNSNGTPDASFSDGACLTEGSIQGCVRSQATASAGYKDIGYGVGVDSADRIVATGVSCGNCSPAYTVVWRRNTDGSLDSTFNGGFADFIGSVGGVLDNGKGMRIDSSGRIIVTGTSSGQMALWRLNADGTPDTTLSQPGCNAGGSGGGCATVSTALGGTSDVGLNVVIDGLGRYVVTGLSTDPSTNPHGVVWRFNSDGSPDETFAGGSNFVVLPNPGGGTSLNPNSDRMGLFLDVAGRIVVTSYGPNAGGQNTMSIWRIIP